MNRRQELLNEILPLATKLSDLAVHLKLGVGKVNVEHPGDGVIELGLCKTNPDGTGNISCRWQANEFIEDLWKLSLLCEEVQDIDNPSP